MPGQGFWRVLSRILLLHDFRYDLPLSSKVNGEGEQPWQSASKGPISPVGRVYGLLLRYGIVPCQLFERQFGLTLSPAVKLAEEFLERQREAR